MTSDIRIVRDIESEVRERASCARHLQEHHPGSTEECISAWRAELWEILRVYDIRRRQFTIPTISQLLQGDPRRGGALEIRKIEQHLQGSVDTEPSAPALMMVCCFYLFITAPTDPLLDVAWVSVFHRRMAEIDRRMEQTI